MWKFILSFCAGFLCCIGLLMAIFVYFIRTQTTTVKNLRAEQLQDRHLTMAGWIRISNDILLVQYAVERPREAEMSQSWISPLYGLYQSSTSYSSFIISRFMGNPTPYLETEKPSPKPYQDYYGVLKLKTLFLYTDDTKRQFVKSIMIPHYSVSLTPASLKDHELFMPQHPILLKVLDECQELPIEPFICIYPFTASEKEDWYVILRRVISLPTHGDLEALSLVHRDGECMKQYSEAMKKLVENTKGSNNDSNLTATAWLNALVGRMFVAIHANENVKDWVIERLSRHTIEGEEEESFLGAIAIQDIDIGNSLPVLSNPKLVEISVDGDMLIEMDIEYTGGLRVEAATCASLSVPAWDAYMKPIAVPIVVAVKIKRFSARVLFKIKPFWETNRIWFGFYREPELKLELECEPVISNKLIKIQMVNQVIEQRIKAALESYVMLPNMDDLSFWDFTDLNESPFEEDVLIVQDGLGSSSNQEGLGPEYDLEKNDILNAALMGEAIETNIYGNTFKKFQPSTFTQESLDDTTLNNITGDPSTAERLESDKSEHTAPPSPEPLIRQSSSNSIDEAPIDTRSEISEAPSSLIEYLGNAAYSLGKWSRYVGLDSKTKVVASSVADYTIPVLTYAHEKTAGYRDIVRNQAAAIGLGAIEKLGLKPDPVDSTNSPGRDSVNSNEDSPPKLRSKASTNWSLLGLSISTTAPTESPPALRSKVSRKSLKTIDSPALQHSSSQSSISTPSLSRRTSTNSLLSDISYQEFEECDDFLEEEYKSVFVNSSMRLRTKKSTQDGDATPTSVSRKLSMKDS